MSLILRLLRGAIPLMFFFLVGKLLKNFIAVYQYQHSRQGGSSHSGGSSNRQQSYGGSSGRNTDPYEVLGCSSSSSNEDIKKKYRELIAKYHPDRFVGMSLDDEFVKLASDKFQDIQSAYSSIRSSRGF